MREPSPPTAILGPYPESLSTNEALRGGVSLAVSAPNPGIAGVGARWYLNWSYVPHDNVDLEFVPLIGGYPGDEQVSPEHLRQVERTLRDNPSNYPDGTLFLVGNEIGYRHQKDERTPREYAEDFHACYHLLKKINATFQVSVGPAILSQDKRITRAQVGAEDGLDYLQKVLTEYRNLYSEVIPADYFAATGHVMTADEEALDRFKERILNLRQILAKAGLRHRGVVLTEFGVPLRGSSPGAIESFMEQSIRFVATATDPDVGHTADGHKLVQRWAWFTARPLSLFDKLRNLGFGAFSIQLATTSLYDIDGNPTHLGRMYRLMMRGRD